MIWFFAVALCAVSFAAQKDAAPIAHAGKGYHNQNFKNKKPRS
jgi:hypothetical protein